MRVIGYVRVSTEEQAATGLSLATQADRLTDYCSARGWTLAALYRDAGVSGRTLERPALQAALESLEAGDADVLLALKLDRLTRSVADLGRLIELSKVHGFQLATVSESLDTTNAAGRMMANILGSVAQWEREAAGERTAAALRFKQSRGEWIGCPPFGFKLNGDGGLHVDAAEMAVIQRMKRLRRRGASYQVIADKMNLAGINSRRGTWSKSSVRTLVNDHLRSRKARYVKGSNGVGVQ